MSFSDALRIDPDARAITHKPELAPDAPEVTSHDWLPAGPIQVGVTAGASTPNNKIGEAVERILATRGIPVSPTAGV